MTRKKVKLAFINDDNARKATFRKRKKGIMKKVSELSVLCGIKTCAIITSPFDSEIEVWPDSEGAKQVMERYQNSSVVDERKNMTQESFIGQKISKSTDQLNKKLQENHEKERTLAMLESMQTKELPKNMSITDMKDMDQLIEQYMKDIRNKMVILD